MADDEDLRLLLSGEKDLSQCNFSDATIEGQDLRERIFRGANFERSKFLNCDLSGADLAGVKWTQTVLSGSKLRDVLIERSVFQVDFSNADLSNSRFNGLYNNCFWIGTDLRGADFRRSRFSTVDDLSQARVDKRTNFDSVLMPRAMSRGALFAGYSFKRERLHAEPGALAGEDGSDTEGDSDGGQVGLTEGFDLVPSRLRGNPQDIGAMAQALRTSILDRLADMPPPNEPEQLDRYQAFVAILQEIGQKLGEIAEHLAEYSGDDSKGENIEKATGVVRNLRSLIEAWVNTNKESLVDYGSRLGLIGAGSAFLAFCGAPPHMAFPVATALLAGEKFAALFTKGDAAS